MRKAIGSLRGSVRKISRNEDNVRSKAAAKKTDALASTKKEAREREIQNRAGELHAKSSPLVTRSDQPEKQKSRGSQRTRAR